MIRTPSVPLRGASDGHRGRQVAALIQAGATTEGALTSLGLFEAHRRKTGAAGDGCEVCVHVHRVLTGRQVL